MIDRDRYHQSPNQDFELRAARTRVAHSQLYALLAGPNAEEKMNYEVNQDFFFERVYTTGPFRISTPIERKGAPVKRDATFVIIKTIKSAEPQSPSLQTVIVYPATGTPFEVSASLIELPHFSVPNKKNVPKDPKTILQVMSEKNIEGKPISELQQAELILISSKIQVNIKPTNNRANFH